MLGLAGARWLGTDSSHILPHDVCFKAGFKYCRTCPPSPLQWGTLLIPSKMRVGKPRMSTRCQARAHGLQAPLSGVEICRARRARLAKACRRCRWCWVRSGLLEQTRQVAQAAPQGAAECAGIWQNTTKPPPPKDGSWWACSIGMVLCQCNSLCCEVQIQIQFAMRRATLTGKLL